MNLEHPTFGIIAQGGSAFGLMVMAVILVAFSSSNLVETRAFSQEEKVRIVTKKPWRVEPVTIISAKTKKKGNVELGKAFVEDDDWLDGFSIAVLNDWYKVVTAVAVEITFRREPGDTRPPFATELNFGPSPITPAYTRRNMNKVIRPGETVDSRCARKLTQALRPRCKD